MRQRQLRARQWIVVVGFVGLFFVARAGASAIAADWVTVPRPPGETCATARPIAGLPFSTVGSTVGYWDDYDEACPDVGGGSPDVVYSYAPAADQAVDIVLCAPGSLTDFDTKVYVYRDACVGGTAVACNDDSCSTFAYPAPYVSRIMNLSLVGGHTYYFVVDGSGAEAGTYQLDVSAVQSFAQCPPDSLYSQNPDGPEGDWHALVSAITSEFNYKCFESFPASVTEEAPYMYWYGLLAHYESDGWVACEVDSLSFRVELHEDDNGLPGHGCICCMFSVSPTPTNVYYNGLRLYRFEARVPALTWTGPAWILLQSWESAGACEFIWLSSHQGDQRCLRSSGVGNPLVPEPFDLSLCFSPSDGYPLGACCDEQTGTCTDVASSYYCAAPGHFIAAVTCEDLMPPCGAPSGACCHPGGTCNVVAQVQCGDHWAGADTACSACPCNFTCPPDSVAEPEECGEATDNGCDAVPHVFAPIALGQTICGTYWAAAGAHDTDWYEFVSDQALTFTWAVRGSLATAVEFFAETDSCGGFPFVSIAFPPGHEASYSLDMCFDPGRYWFVVHPVSPPEWACSQTYTFRLTAEVCGTVGACCFINGTCRLMTESSCQNQNGTWQGAGSGCTPNSCVPVVCRGDCDCDGYVGFSDIDYFVAAIPDDEASWAALYAARHWGNPPLCAFANCDANGDGHVNFADIDPFVALTPSACP